MSQINMLLLINSEFMSFIFFNIFLFIKNPKKPFILVIFLIYCSSNFNKIQIENESNYI
jgi:hypothetical protein